VTKLNQPQLEAMRYLEGPCLVLAGAGSGKTSVITQKIAHLIRRAGYQAKHVAAVTFTNKAAREMRERVSQLLDADVAEGLTVSTFHTLGLNILRREARALGYRSGITIFDAQDSGALLRELLRKSSGADELANTVQWRISGWKSDLVSPEQAEGLAQEPADVAAALVYGEYERHLKAYNAVDFDDLILKPVQLFRTNQEVLDRWRGRIRYLLVDEYQDTNGAQYELVRQLVAMRAAFTVVGDDDQSIYTWRGAKPENLRELQADFPSLRVIKLEQNYRSLGRILKAANVLIARNSHVFEKRLWSERGFGDPIRVLECRDETHEAAKVVGEIMAQRFRHNTPLADFAILYRGNHQAKRFEQALREQQLPYFLSGGNSFFERTEIKDVMAYLRLIVNPRDDSAFLRVINTPRREIGATTLERLGAYAQGRRISLAKAAGELGAQTQLPTRSREQVAAFASWLAEITHHATSAQPGELLRKLLRDIRYERWLSETSRLPEAAESAWQNVCDLRDWIERLGKEEQSLEGAVAKLVLQDLLERQDEEDSGDRITLTTLHAAKGLEFPHVFLVGVEEEILPHRTSIEEENIEEERRLCYVGITRAEHNLTITYAAKRKRYGEMVRCQPSRFLEELPQEDLDWRRRGHQLDPEERQAVGEAHLANLRGLLGN
jgi:ATP-dependent DNA helicase Rep